MNTRAFSAGFADGRQERVEGRVSRDYPCRRRVYAFRAYAETAVGLHDHLNDVPVTQTDGGVEGVRGHHKVRGGVSSSS